jgi:predicted amidohydrolase
VKVCGVGSLFGGRLQGRSLVAAPWGVLNRVPPTEEDRPQVITANLSIDELREFRAHFQPRQSAAR